MVSQVEFGEEACERAAVAAAYGEPATSELDVAAACFGAQVVELVPGVTRRVEDASCAQGGKAAGGGGSQAAGWEGCARRDRGERRARADAAPHGAAER